MLIEIDRHEKKCKAKERVPLANKDSQREEDGSRGFVNVEEIKRSLDEQNAQDGDAGHLAERNGPEEVKVTELASLQITSQL